MRKNFPSATLRGSEGADAPMEYTLREWNVFGIAKDDTMIHLLDTASFTEMGAVHAGWMNVAFRDIKRTIKNVVAMPK